MKAHVFALCLSLSLCLGLPLPALAFASPFTDVQETSPYYDAILWAAETGVTNGTTASTFSPDAPCTRAQLAVFLWRAAGEPKPALAEQQFMDVTDPSAYYYGAVQWAAEKDMWCPGPWKTASPTARPMACSAPMTPALAARS